jgi:phosphate acyltransferase
MLRIAVDAMGGDRAPLEIVRGAEAASSEKIAEIVLVGDENVISPLIEKPQGIEIVHTSVSVDMKESPSSALRRKRDSSVNKALQLLKAGHVQAVVSAGNSGAAMAFAIFTLGRTEGVDRPAILTTHPNAIGTKSIMLDAGGTVDCRPSHLVQFAIMGSAFAQHALGINNPKVGLLSNGEEDTKGNELTRETHGILKGLDLNYVGYVEGTELYNGQVDVVVTDGFVGNVALKISEGVAELILSLLKNYISKEKANNSRGSDNLLSIFKDFTSQMDYSEYGGVPLIGVNGVCIICHGKSDSRAIKNAIAQATGFVGKNLNEHVRNAILRYSTPTIIKEH